MKLISKRVASSASAFISHYYYYKTSTHYPIHHHHHYHHYFYQHHKPLTSNCKYSGTRMKMSMTTNNNDNNSNKAINRTFLHYQTLSSTQDELRNQLTLQLQSSLQYNKTNTHDNYIAITSSIQTKGRGTNKRSWISTKGNTFLSLSIPYSAVMENGNVPLTLLPIQIGILIARRIDELVNQNGIGGSAAAAAAGGGGSGYTSRFSKSNRNNNNNNHCNVRVKWPNDVLINGEKVAGVLIESENITCNNTLHDQFFIIGIGINYKYAPIIEQSGSERGRKATCICDHLPVDKNDVDNDRIRSIETKAKELGITIANDIWDWIDWQSSLSSFSNNNNNHHHHNHHDSSKEFVTESIITNFEHWTDFGQEFILRDDITTGNEVVIPIGIEKDGRLRVRGKKDGVERFLCTDYLL